MIMSPLETDTDDLPQSLPIEEVEAIVRLLGRVAGMNAPIVERRRVLMQDLCQLIRSDVWLWMHSRVDPATRFPTAFKIIDGGWRNDAERVSFVSALHDGEINARIIAKQIPVPHHTTLRQELLSELDPTESILLDRWSGLSGMRESITTVYALGGGAFSALGFHRRSGGPTFTPGERCIVHLIASQIDWLHRAETDVPANSDQLLHLSPRQREVLVHLMSGDSRKQIAIKLHLSEHTISGHMKEIYRVFGVGSRIELLSLFMSGGHR
jgi:DNA-binding CsgD family transcriptional regulator